MPQMVVTMYPVAVNWCRILSILVPVLSKKLRNTGICRRKTQPAMSKTNSESMMRSVTTVPKDLGNEIPSQRFSTAAGKLSNARHQQTQGITHENGVDADTISRVLSNGVECLFPSPTTEGLSQDTERE